MKKAPSGVGAPHRGGTGDTSPRGISRQPSGSPRGPRGGYSSMTPPSGRKPADEFRMSIAELTTLKEQAVGNEDFDEAARLKQVMVLKERSYAEILAFKTEAVEAEDFEGAAVLKEYLDVKKTEEESGGLAPPASGLGGRRASTGPSLEVLQRQKTEAVARGDFDEAQRLKVLIQAMGDGLTSGTIQVPAEEPVLPIDELQRLRKAAVARQDFAEAQRISAQIDKCAPDKGPDAYKGREVIGKGAYGTVYKVTHRRDNRILILKEPIGVPEETVKAEALVMERLKHPNIVELVDHYSEKGEYIIVTEFCVGGDLRKFQDRHPKTNRCLAQGIAMRIFGETLDGVKYLHDQGILHRDLKPDNILLMTKEGATAKIADFGEAKAAIQAQTFRGTPCYMAPELISARTYGAGNDVWALGCILYEMAKGKFAFDPKDPRAIYQGKIPKDAPPWCSKVVLAALEYDQKKRPDVGKLRKLMDAKVTAPGSRTT